MKKWIFGIITALGALVICVLLFDVIFKKTSPLFQFLSAAIGYFAGSSVYKYFKSKESKPI